MTNIAILQKAIKKAKSNGWEYYDDLFYESKDGVAFARHLEDSVSIGECMYEIIFSHDFAKAFFGEGQYFDPEDGKTYWVKQDNHMEEIQFEMWQFHLQQMVLKPEPLQYLAEFLEEGTTV